MAASSDLPSARGVSGDGGGGATSECSAPAPLRQHVTLTARFGHDGRHVETVYAASDTCLEDLGRLLVRAGGCVAFLSRCDSVSLSQPALARAAARTRPPAQPLPGRDVAGCARRARRYRAAHPPRRARRSRVAHLSARVFQSGARVLTTRRAASSAAT